MIYDMFSNRRIAIVCNPSTYFQFNNETILLKKRTYLKKQDWKIDVVALLRPTVFWEKSVSLLSAEKWCYSVKY